MDNWLYATSVLGCLFIAYIAFKISYKYIFNDQHEDGCIKYGCGVILVFITVYLIFMTAATLKWMNSESSKNTGNETTFGSVYICNGETSTKYHCDPDCKGLSRCSGEIEEISEEEAEDMGRTPCNICY